MKKTGIFYGSTTGITGEVAGELAKVLGVAQEDIHNVADTAPSAVAEYENILLGSSTWGSGELQDDMYDFLDGLEGMSLAGKKIAVFGCGDESMSDTFCNAVGILYDAAVSTGADVVGAFNVDGYDFSHSDAVRDGVAVGLLIDNVNHEDLTEARVKQWAESLNF